MAFIARLLRPSGEEIRSVVIRETDRAHAAEFEQICAGPALTVLALAGIALCAAVVAPYWAIARLAGLRR